MTQEEEILKGSKIIAIVGLSSNPDRPSNEVGRYLKAHGYSVIPVNPNEKAILGETCYPDLSSIPVKVDVVDVFRRAEDVPPIAAEAVKIGAKVLWMQEGIVSEEAAATGRQGGLTVVMDRCMKKEHQKLK
jgi:predicted CoA-binding protein